LETSLQLKLEIRIRIYCAVIDSSGKIPLGLSSNPKGDDQNEKKKLFLDFLVTSLERKEQLDNFRKNWGTSQEKYKSWIEQIKQNGARHGQQMQENATSWWK